ncbi:hypothetical protein BGX24_002199 [Mortierella sp. AD032]|nr:hypothetical protein BGX24_002199 [Mortierella sp. AD032]
MVRSQIRRQRRRHSITGGGFAWTTTTTLPPRHALHMPVMKISPLIRRKEQHQRNIHRLMHEGREVEVMRRRGVATVMDTSEEGDEDDEEGMAGVVFTGASIQQSALLNEHAQMQAKQEFAMLVAESSKAYQGILQQRHLQLQQHQQQEQQQRAAAAAIEDEEQRRRNSWPKQQITTGTGAITYANVPLTFQQQQQQQHVYLQQQALQQQRLIQLQQQQRQLQFQQQKQLLLQQQQQIQQQIQQQQLYKQRLNASSNPALNIQTGFPSPPQQQQPQQSQQQQQLMQIQTPQQRGANALNFVKNLNQNNATTTAANWSYSSHHAASTGRLSLY